MTETRQPHSRAGVASVLIAAGLIILAIVLWTLFLVGGSGDREFRKTMGWVLGISMGVVAPLGHITGVVFGIVGATRKRRRRKLAVLGLVFNGLFVVGAILLFVVGLSGIGAH